MLRKRRGDYKLSNCREWSGWCSYPKWLCRRPCLAGHAGELITSEKVTIALLVYRKQVKQKTLGDGYTSRAAAIALPPFGPNKRCLKLSFFSWMFLRKNETGVMFKHLHAAMYNFLPVASYFSAFSGNETQSCHKLMAWASVFSRRKVEPDPSSFRS